MFGWSESWDQATAWRYRPSRLEALARTPLADIDAAELAELSVTDEEAPLATFIAALVAYVRSR